MQILLDYIHEMYYYLLAMSDDDIADFHINQRDSRAKLFDEMKASFDTFEPVSKQRILDAIEFIFSSGDIRGYWRAVVPHAVPLDEVEVKSGYLRELYERLKGQDPPLTDFGTSVELADAVGAHGINVRQ
jgi:hypothetical protein